MTSYGTEENNKQWETIRTSSGTSYRPCTPAEHCLAWKSRSSAWKQTLCTRSSHLFIQANLTPYESAPLMTRVTTHKIYKVKFTLQPWMGTVLSLEVIHAWVTFQLLRTILLELEEAGCDYPLYTISHDLNTVFLGKTIMAILWVITDGITVHLRNVLRIWEDYLI